MRHVLPIGWHQLFITGWSIQVRIALCRNTLWGHATGRNSPTVLEATGGLLAQPSWQANVCRYGCARDCEKVYGNVTSSKWCHYYWIISQIYQDTARTSEHWKRSDVMTTKPSDARLLNINPVRPSTDTKMMTNLEMFPWILVILNYFYWLKWPTGSREIFGTSRLTGLLCHWHLVVLYVAIKQHCTKRCNVESIYTAWRM